jgi:hypothetical protein
VVQCEEGVICPPRMFECRRVCENYYQADAACVEPDTFCVPLYDTLTGDFTQQGVCARSECDDIATCSAGSGRLLCVFFGAQQVGRCFGACHYRVVAGSYSDDDAGGTCHPVGPNDDPALVDWPIGTQPDAAECDPVQAACAEGLVCIAPGAQPLATCHRLCDPTSHEGCVAPQTCVQSPNPDFAYCD